MTTETIARFSYDDPQHWANPALIDWQVFEDAQRISVAQLVQKANKLQKQVKELQNQYQAEPA